ncbi:hypothetical protein ACFYWS_39395 [Streptomyces sp. NPDC002795]|uniref:hypothetical protein n=1 Tax=Streptomyces sp. NPDC002795 TaxID=3364665 RepID=UPI003676702D
MSHDAPDRAELAIREWLHKRVTPKVEEQPLPAAPTHLPPGYAPAPDPDDWFTRLYGPDGESPIETPTSPDLDPEPGPEVEDDDPEPAPYEGHRPSRRALVDVTHNAAPRLRWLALHTTAAAAGYPLGLVNWGQNTAAWLTAGHWTAPSAWVVYAVGVMGLALYRRTHRSLLLVAWLGAVPISSVVLGVLLHGRA